MFGLDTTEAARACFGGHTPQKQAAAAHNFVFTRRYHSNVIARFGCPTEIAL